MTTPPRRRSPGETLSARARSLVTSPWKSPDTPLTPPRVEGSLAEEDHLHRTMSVLRHSILRCEYWLSPNGLFREWCRRCLLLALFIAVPLLCFSPLVTVFLEHLTAWSAALLEICSNLAQIPGHLSVGVLIAIPGALMLRWLLRH